MYKYSLTSWTLKSPSVYPTVMRNNLELLALRNKCFWHFKPGSSCRKIICTVSLRTIYKRGQVQITKRSWQIYNMPPSARKDCTKSKTTTKYSLNFQTQHNKNWCLSSLINCTSDMVTMTDCTWMPRANFTFKKIHPRLLCYITTLKQTVEH